MSSNQTLSILTEQSTKSKVAMAGPTELSRWEEEEAQPAWARAALGCTAISLGLCLGPQDQQDTDTDVLAGQNSTGGKEQGKVFAKPPPHSLAMDLPKPQGVTYGGVTACRRHTNIAPTS